jgi:hypothetical protein
MTPSRIEAPFPFGARGSTVSGRQRHPAFVAPRSMSEELSHCSFVSYTEFGIQMAPLHHPRRPGSVVCVHSTQ